MIKDLQTGYELIKSIPPPLALATFKCYLNMNVSILYYLIYDIITL